MYMPDWSEVRYFPCRGQYIFNTQLSYYSSRYLSILTRSYTFCAKIKHGLPTMNEDQVASYIRTSFGHLNIVLHYNNHEYNFIFACPLYS